MKPFKFTVTEKKVSATGFKFYKDRYGKQRCYYIGGGKGKAIPIDLEKYPLGSTEFIVHARLIYENSTSKKQKKSIETLKDLFEEFRVSKDYLKLAYSTKRQNEKIFDRLPIVQHLHFKTLTAPDLYRLRDRAAVKVTDDYANRLIKLLRVIFAYALERGHVTHNVAKNVKMIKIARETKANRPWSEKEIRVVLSASPPHIRTPLLFMLNTGFSPVDAFSLTKDKIKDGMIPTARSKTGVAVMWKVSGAVLSAIEQHMNAHTSDKVFANSYGNAWTQDGFNAVWQRLKKKLASEGRVGSDLTLYGLRHTMAALLKQAGYADEQIAESLGQSTTGATLRYIQGADLSHTMKKITEEMNGRIESILSN